MGCFFDCFRVRNDDDPHRSRSRSRSRSSPRLIDNSSPSSATERAGEKIRISSLFAAEDKEECVAMERENLVRRVSRPEFDEGILEEVKLLKACGTLPETPAEIRRTVKFTEQLEKSDIKNPLIDLQSLPETPAAIRKEAIRTETSPQSAVDSSSPETPEETEKPTFVSDVQGPRSVVKASPYPTPRKITDDMQTPGTVYATNMKSLTKGNARIRSQYVYTSLNPIDSLCELDDATEEHSDSNLTSDREVESCLQPGEGTPLPAKESDGKSVNEERLGDASLSSWLKPPPTASTRKPNFGKTPGDRPIIGLVASHWNEQEETPHGPPKWWDGNGIPNSTTKYKEDQKVCWHATPFEERLEKALSEETYPPQRKPVTGAPIIFEELEGQDTPTSQLQTTPKSVVSF